MARFDSITAGQTFTKRFWNGWTWSTQTFTATEEALTNRRLTVVPVVNPNGGEIMLHGKPNEEVEIH